MTVHEYASRLTLTGQGTVRLADLSIAAAAASRFGILTSVRAFDGAGLRDAVNQIALHPLPELGDERAEWESLATEAQQAARTLEGAAALDEWIVSSQAATAGRKTRGAYATPMPLARLLASAAVGPLKGRNREVRVVDPSAGTGALLLAALQLLAKGADKRQLENYTYSLHGVEIDPSSRELCCLLLWIAGARASVSLKQIASNIVVDNAVTRDWWTGTRGPFDALIMNPPWESLRHAVPDADAQSQARVDTVNRLQYSSPGAAGLPPLFTAQGKGDRNLFKLFLELAPHLLTPGGRLAVLVPGAFGSDLGMSELRIRYFEQFALERWTTFENLLRLFPIDSRYKYGVLVGERSQGGTRAIAMRGFATEPRHVQADHIIVARGDLEKIGGPSRMLPELRTERELETLSRVLEFGSGLFEPGSLGRVKYRREIDLTLGRAKGLFARFDSYPDLSPQLDGSFVTAEGNRLVPVVEGRMVGRYDFYQKSWDGGRGRTASWSLNVNRGLEECRPQFVAPPQIKHVQRLAICDVTSATNTRTVHATWVPNDWPCGNTAPVLVFEDEQRAFAGLAILNSMVFDWVARRLMSGLHMNKFYLDALVWPQLSPDAVARLASDARALCTHDPRFAAMTRIPGGQDGVPNADYESAHVAIERHVAQGYGLTQQMIREMFSADRDDRRGFWRYYDKEPRAVSIASRVLDRTNPAEPVLAGAHA